VTRHVHENAASSQQFHAVFLGRTQPKIGTPRRSRSSSTPVPAESPKTRATRRRSASSCQARITRFPRHPGDEADLHQILPRSTFRPGVVVAPIPHDLPRRARRFLWHRGDRDASLWSLGVALNVEFPDDQGRVSGRFAPHVAQGPDPLPRRPPHRRGATSAYQFHARRSEDAHLRASRCAT